MLFRVTDPPTGLPAVLFVETDISAQIRQSQEITHMHAESEALAQAKQKAEDFLGAMSHEIRTPLHGIIGLTETLNDKVKTCQIPEVKYIVHNLSKSCEYLLSLVNQSLDIARLDANKIELNITPCSIYEKLEEVVSWVQLMAKEKSVEIGVFLPVDLSTIRTDSSRLNQIILNLLTNAIKFSEKGNIEIHVQLSSQLHYNDFGRWKDPTNISSTIANLSRPVEPAPRYLQFAIFDEGEGISMAGMKSIFDKYSQLKSEDTVIKPQYSGSGLGLVICKELSQLMNGNIGVHSIKGEGSTFWVSIPYEPLEPKQTPLDLDLSFIEIALLIETPLYIKSIKYYCNLWNIKISTFKSESIEAYDAIIIEDIPHLTSYLSQNEIPKQTKIILITQHLESIYRVLTPPIHPRCFLNCLDLHLGRGHESDSPKKQSELSHSYSKHVLVAEDNVVNRLVLKNFLSSFGYSFTLTKNGQEAYQSFVTESYDLILMDFSMPVMDGIEATILIRKYEKKTGREPIPIICLTASKSKKIKLKCDKAGVDGILYKPFTKEDLRMIIGSYF